MDINLTLSRVFFPGIILHELSHAIACVALGVKIKKIKWISKEGGFVIHEHNKSYKTIIISVMPFFLNIVYAIACALLFTTNVGPILKVVLLWIGASALFFCLPSKDDSKNVFDSVKDSYTKKQSILRWFYKIILIPVTLVILILCWIFMILDESLFFRLLLIIFWVYLFII